MRQFIHWLLCAWNDANMSVWLNEDCNLLRPAVFTLEGGLKFLDDCNGCLDISIFKDRVNFFTWGDWIIHGDRQMKSLELRRVVRKLICRTSDVLI